MPDYIINRLSAAKRIEDYKKLVVVLSQSVHKDAPELYKKFMKELEELHEFVKQG